MLTKDSHICLIECEFSSECVLNLSTLVDLIISDNYSDPTDIRVSFYTYVGSPLKVTAVYSNNKKSKIPFEKNNKGRKRPFFIKESLNNFLSSTNKMFLFELHSFNKEITSNDSQIDTVNFEHICLLYHKLTKMKFDFYFLISGIPNSSRRYTSVKDSDYHRARSFLFLESLYGVNERIKVYAEFCDNWVSFYNPDVVERINDPKQKTDVIMNDSKFGKILPLISINKETYSCFHKKAYLFKENQSPDLIEIRIRELMHFFILRLKPLLSKDEQKLLNSLLPLDNLFEAIVFLSTLYYVSENNHNILEKIEQLHENCIDYAQGVFQLLENSYYHVITESDTGWGNVAFRIRLVNPELNLPNKYNYEIHVNDLLESQSGTVGVVDNLVENYPELKGAAIELEHVFNYSKNKKLAEFWGKEKNIAHHYGLMILNNAVLSHKGIIHVRSADSIYFSDAPDLKYDKQIPWINGTSYYLEIPIILNKSEFIHWDNIALQNPSFNNSRGSSEVLIGKNKLDLSTCFFSSKQKQTFIDKKFALLNKTSFNKDVVYIIDCTEINSETEYEVLAKVVFLLLSSSNDLERVAFINLGSKYNVIKIFRQFAMFYNRQGMNKTLSNKGVFFVDKEAKLPLLLLGHIIDIINEIYALELTGEVDETAATIINCLGGRVNEPKEIL